MADGSFFEDFRKWKIKDLEKAGFSHIDGDRIICYDCGLVPRLVGGRNPAEIHAELCTHCEFVRKNNLRQSTEDDSTQSPELAQACTGNDDEEGQHRFLLPYAGVGDGTADQNIKPVQASYSLKDQHQGGAQLEFPYRKAELEMKTKCMNSSCDKIPSYILFPCQHVICEECASMLVECPKCGGRIDNKENFFWA